MNANEYIPDFSARARLLVRRGAVSLLRHTTQASERSAVLRVHDGELVFMVRLLADTATPRLNSLSVDCWHLSPGGYKRCVSLQNGGFCVHAFAALVFMVKQVDMEIAFIRAANSTARLRALGYRIGEMRFVGSRRNKKPVLIGLRPKEKDDAWAPIV